MVFGTNTSDVLSLNLYDNCLCLNCTDDRMKVLDIIEECQSDARRTPKDNAPAVGKCTSPSFPYRLIYPLLQTSLCRRRKSFLTKPIVENKY